MFPHGSGSPGSSVALKVDCAQKPGGMGRSRAKTKSSLGGPLKPHPRKRVSSRPPAETRIGIVVKGGALTGVMVREATPLTVRTSAGPGATPSASKETNVPFGTGWPFARKTVAVMVEGVKPSHGMDWGTALTDSDA